MRAMRGHVLLLAGVVESAKRFGMHIKFDALSVIGDHHSRGSSHRPFVNPHFDIECLGIEAIPGQFFDCAPRFGGPKMFLDSFPVEFCFS